MEKAGTNFQMVSFGPIVTRTETTDDGRRVEFMDTLHLTGAEISINSFGPNEFTPFVHAHKLNEEIYFILKGEGVFKVDEQEFAVNEGDMIRIDPAGHRTIKAGNDGMTYMCIQVEQNSLTQATADDGIMIEDDKASWMD